jgi:hypothetical protein
MDKGINSKYSWAAEIMTGVCPESRCGIAIYPTNAPGTAIIKATKLPVI